MYLFNLCFCFQVRDHDHITGRYRGAAHSRCNLQLRKTYKIPVFFHNFRKYDAHLLVNGLKLFPDEKLGVIGQGLERYLTLSLGEHIVFKDSLMFMNASLDRLGKNLLAAGRHHFTHLLKEFDGTPDASIDLLRKGIYPYDYMNDMVRFNETTLPPRENFFTMLRDQECNEQDYTHATKVGSTFNCTTMKDYHDLYLKSMSQSFTIHYNYQSNFQFLTNA